MISIHTDEPYRIKYDSQATNWMFAIYYVYHKTKTNPNELLFIYCPREMSRVITRNSEVYTYDTVLHKYEESHAQFRHTHWPGSWRNSCTYLKENI